ncbi:hypothetical protein ACFX12_009939 [Malus domestica]
MSSKSSAGRLEQVCSSSFSFFVLLAFLLLFVIVSANDFSFLFLPAMANLIALLFRERKKERVKEQEICVSLVGFERSENFWDSSGQCIVGDVEKLE